MDCKKRWQKVVEGDAEMLPIFSWFQLLVFFFLCDIQNDNVYLPAVSGMLYWIVVSVTVWLKRVLKKEERPESQDSSLREIMKEFPSLQVWLSAPYNFRGTWLFWHQSFWGNTNTMIGLTSEHFAVKWLSLPGNLKKILKKVFFHVVSYLKVTLLLHTH